MQVKLPSEYYAVGSFSVCEKMAAAFLMVLVLSLSQVDGEQDECSYEPENNSTTVTWDLVLRFPVYVKPQEPPAVDDDGMPADQQQNNHSATLCWRKTRRKKDEDECLDTMNFSINNTVHEWQQLKNLSAELKDQGMVTVLTVMGDVAGAFMGIPTLGNTSRDSDDDESNNGVLTVKTSTGLLWAIGCHPLTTKNDPDGLTSTTPDAPYTGSSGGNAWKTLAIITIILVLITVPFAIYNYLKRPSENRSRRKSAAMSNMSNGREMKADPATEGSGPRYSVTLTSTSNSPSDNHRRSRLSSIVTSKKGHVRNLSVDGKKTVENMTAPSSTPSPVPPPSLAVPTSAPPIPKSSSVNASRTRPSYVPPKPSKSLECIIKEVPNGTEGEGMDDDGEHDYAYLDLNMLKTQMERDKKKEEQMKRENDPTVTMHESVNSLYESIPITGQKGPEEGIRTQTKDEKTKKKIEEGYQPCLTTYDSVNSLYEATEAIAKKRIIMEDGVKSNEKQKENAAQKEKSETHEGDPFEPSTRTRCCSENSLYETVPATTYHQETHDEGSKTQNKEENTDEKTKEVKEGGQPCLTTYDSINSLYEANDAIFKKQQEGEEKVTKPKEEQEEQEDLMITKKEDPLGLPCRRVSVDENSLYESFSMSAVADEDDNDDADADDDDDDDGQQQGGTNNKGSTDDKDKDNDSADEDDESEVEESKKDADQENVNEGKESGHDENTTL